jgi:hypothetical protein
MGQLPSLKNGGSWNDTAALGGEIVMNFLVPQPETPVLPGVTIHETAPLASTTFRLWTCRDDAEGRKRPPRRHLGDENIDLQVLALIRTVVELSSSPIV